MVWVLGFLLLGALALGTFIVLRGGPRPGPHPKPAPNHKAATRSVSPAPRPTNAWAKRLTPDPKACEAARTLAEQYLPLDQTPILPLPGCGNISCQCRFEPQPERRQGLERRQGGERRALARFDAPVDRRSGEFRRKSDHFAWHTTI